MKQYRARMIVNAILIVIGLLLTLIADHALQRYLGLGLTAVGVLGLVVAVIDARRNSN